MKTKLLINPFERIAGWQALGLGVFIMALTAVLGKINNVAFDGVLDAHTGSHSFKAAFAMQAINLLVLFLCMWLAGACFSKSKIRAVDIVGTMALSRTPMLLLTILCFLPIVPMDLSNILRMIIFTLCCLVLGIWMIALMYNAYTTSCHIKGTRAVVSFIGALLVAEVISKCIFIFVLSSLLSSADSAGSNGAFAQGSTESAIIVDLSDIHQSTEKIVEAFERKDFDTVAAYFDDTMKKALPVNALKLTWLQITLTKGAFESSDLSNKKETAIDNFDIIDVPLKFKRNELNLRLTFNKDGNLSGLFFIPLSNS